ncbi:MAG: GNVR domain-containing protein [Acidobacteriaceae bacterium]
MQTKEHNSAGMEEAADNLLLSHRAQATAAGSASAEDLLENEDSVDLVEIALVLLRAKRTVLLFALGGFALALIASVLMKPAYKAAASFVPPASSSIGGAAAALASQLGGLGSAKGPGDLYVGILGSRSVEDALIARFDLAKVYRTKKLSDTEKALNSRSKFVADMKSSIVTISVEDHDPRRARDLAAAYLDQLHVENGRLALTEASQRRLFFSEQLEKEKSALSDAEVDLAKTEEATGFIAPASQTGAQLGTIAQTRAEIAGREVQLASLRQGATDQNPEVIRLMTEIDDLKAQLNRLQSNASPGSIPTSKVPSLALEYVRKEREVKYHEALFEMLARQLEAARLDESRNAPVLQVLDYPAIPDKKSWPPRALLALGGLLLGAFLGMIWALVRERLRQLESDPEVAARFAELRKAASLR